MVLGNKSEHQKAFDIICKHMLEQNERSVSKVSGACRYRGQSGMMCAIGVLIDDEHYYPEIEGKSACETVVRQSLRSSGWELDDSFLVALQDIHDLAAPEKWKERLSDVGRGFRLKVDE